MENLKLADTDSSDDPQEIHILVGNDHYWNIMTGEVIRGKEGPVAMNSKFGYILSGEVAGSNDTSTRTLVTNVLRVSSEQELDSCVKRF